MWITHADMVPASIVGIFFGVYIAFYVSGSFMGVGGLFIVIGTATILWSMSQKRG